MIYKQDGRLMNDGKIISKCPYCKINFWENKWALDEKTGRCLNCRNYNELYNSKQT